MKLISISFCVILLTISQSISSPTQSSNQIQKSTLNQKTNKIFNNSAFNKVPKSFEKFFNKSNRDCVSEKLKLSENGEKELIKFEAEMLAVKAVVTCSEHEESEFWKNVFAEISQMLLTGMGDEDLQCVKFLLNQLDSKSNLVEDFNVESMTKDDKETCEARIKRDEKNLRNEISRLIGDDDISAFTCGVLDVSEANKIFCKIILLGTKEDINVKNLELEKLSSVVVEKVDQFFSCRMNKLAQEH